jgi:elongation factor Tu
MEVRELLSFYEYDGDNGPVISGSALGALNGEQEWVTKIDGINGSC